MVTRADSLEDILERGSVRIGVAEFVPWTFRNRDGNLEGFEIDVGNLIAADMGVDADFRVYSLDDLFNAINAGEIDIIAAGLAITPGRALQVEFSIPYQSSGTTLVASKKLAPGAAGVYDLNKPGYTIMTVADTFSAGVALEIYDVAAIKVVADGPAAEKELVQGRAHGYMTSIADAGILVGHYPEQVYLPASEPVVGSVAGLAVKRGNQTLLNFLNAWIAANTANRWLPASHDYWFSGYDWAVNSQQ